MTQYLYTFPEKLIRATFVRRYKRFMADFYLESGELVVAHCPNSGSMKSCLEQGAEACLSPVNNPKRKTRYTWEMIRINGQWVGINTSLPNIMASEAMRQQAIPGLEGYEDIRREVRFGDSRFDILAQNGQEQCYVEIKNVTLNEAGVAMFPDSVTLRGQKHLDTLREVKSQGMRAVLLFVIQRTDVHAFAAASHIDPAYARKLEEAKDSGVEVIPWQVRVTPEGIRPVKLFNYPA